MSATLPKGWAYVDFDDAINVVSDRGFRIKQKDYLPEGKVRVIDQGEGLVGGFTDCIEATINRPLKKCSSNAPGSWISKKRVVQTRLRSECEGHFGLFAGRFAHFGRTYPRAHA